MYIMVFITVPKERGARTIARALVEKKLAACVSSAKGIESLFRWKGAVDKAGEILLIVKSTKARLPRIISLVRSLHPYEVPEIIAVPVIGGYRGYLDWIDESVRQSS